MSELMGLIQIGDRVITRDGHEAVVEEKFAEVNLLSVRRVDDDTITGLLAPEECLVIAPDAQNGAETGKANENGLDQESGWNDVLCAKFERVDGSLMCVEEL